MDKQKFNRTVDRCFKKLEKKCCYFLRHTFIKSMQSYAFKKEVASVVNEKEKVVVQFDFAENFTTQTQNAIQSFYWVSKQFALFIACVWESNGCHSCVIVSDYLQHDKNAIKIFVMELIDHIESIIRCFKNYVFFWCCCFSNRDLPFVKSLNQKKTGARTFLEQAMVRVLLMVSGEL